MNWISHFEDEDRRDLYFRIILPSPALRRFVRYYWVLKCHPDVPAKAEYLASDGFEEIIFSYGGAYLRTEALQGESHDQVIDRSYIVGSKTPGVTCSRYAALNIVGVKLWPRSLHSLLGVSLAELDESVVALQDLPLLWLKELELALFDAKSESAIKATLDRAFERSRLSQHCNALIDLSLQRIFDARGILSVDDILRRTGCHYRTLEKQFKHHVGLSPKTLAKVIRFKHVMHALHAASKPTLTSRLPELSVQDFGFYDQSHFIKEFKYFTGATPTAFLKQSRNISTQVLKFCLDIDVRELEGSNRRMAYEM